MSEEADDDSAFGPLSANPKPESPRPPMTFKQQAELAEYLHGRLSMDDGGEGATLSVSIRLDRPQIDDLWLLAQRLRRMAPYEAEIKKLVTGK